MKLTGARILMECLREQKVDTIFGYPGGTILNVYDALYDCKEITHILTSHEQGAAHAADGYARSTGKVGVCFATSGPGATNLTTGIATAYMDSSSVVFISCNVPQNLIGRDAFQEVDITGITMPITKSTYLVRDVTKLADTVREAFALARSGRPVPAGYYDNVVEYVKAMADANERLHRAKVTDNARVILALTAIGKDVTNVGGHNLLKGLDNMAYVQKQGINGPIFTLIALDSHNYPTMGDVTREKLIKAILDAQLPGGGWTLSGENADTDMTAMAIQALAPYYKTNETVKAAVDKALEALSALQRNDGGFGSWGTVNSESCAQVIVALTALGIDPTADSRFVKNGHTVLDALAGFYVTGGGFKHTADGERNGMATEQGYYALAAYYRFVNAQTRLYDMSDVTIQIDSHTHAFGAWTVTTPATCTTDGVETRSCACGETETRIIPATGHVDADHDGKCDVCQAVITPVDPGKTDPSDPGKTDPTNPGTDTPATGDTGVLVWVIALPVALLAAAFVLKRKEREA